MTDRIILNAEEGMLLTDGVVYGTAIYLAEGADPDRYYQISREEYGAILAQMESEVVA